MYKCITSHNYFSFFMRTFNTFSLSNFKVYNIVSLNIATIMYIVTLKNVNFNHANIQNKNGM